MRHLYDTDLRHIFRHVRLLEFHKIILPVGTISLLIDHPKELTSLSEEHMFVKGSSSNKLLRKNILADFSIKY